MTIQTFTPPVAPSPGTINKPEFRVLSAEFGDGYSQDGPDGINNVRAILALTWETLLPAQAAYITSFIAARKGVEPFWYTPSDEATPIKWTCKDMTDKRGDGGLRTVTATFRRSFNLDT
jgi:phage-related protein